jgi:hypothetical protein
MFLVVKMSDIHSAMARKSAVSGQVDAMAPASG